MSSRCPRKEKLNWFEKELIYEIDPMKFYDGNNDGYGDIQGIEKKFNYLEKNSIKSILLSESLFNDKGFEKEEELKIFIEKVHRKSK